jgi:transcriptional regulator with XRE-family HTH domain
MSQGHGHRLRPRRMHKKLRRIRELLNVSQEGMVNCLRPYASGSPIYPGHISEFESGKREPSLLVLLAYAKAAGISTDILIDDELDLPDSRGGKTRLTVKHKGPNPKTRP